jgi:hypothetical protein
MTEIEKVKAEIKVLEKKLSFLEELERTKTPCEEAFKRIYNVYPSSSEKSVFWTDNDEDTWIAFQNGYKSAQEDYKVGEYQEPEKRKIDDLAEKLLPDDHPYKIADEHGETNPYKQYLNSVKEWEPKPQEPEEQKFKEIPELLDQLDALMETYPLPTVVWKDIRKLMFLSYDKGYSKGGYDTHMKYAGTD